MRPSALPPLADRYCTAINALLRRELNAYTSELRRLTTACMATAPTEPDILKGYKKASPHLSNFVWHCQPFAQTEAVRRNMEIECRTPFHVAAARAGWGVRSLRRA